MSVPFDIHAVPLEKPTPRAMLPVAEVAVEPTPAKSAEVVQAAAPAAPTFTAIPTLAHLGVPFKTSAPVELTELETEYVVRCVKHVFPDQVVFQFNITNTLNDQQLENVRVVLESTESDLSGVKVIPAPSIKYGSPGVVYVVAPLDHSSASETFSAKLEFVVKDCDPETGECDEEGYPDSYTVMLQRGG